jgi:hypothetical protein
VVATTAGSAQAQEESPSGPSAEATEAVALDGSRMTLADFVADVPELDADAESAPRPEVSFLRRLPPGSSEWEGTPDASVAEDGPALLTTYCVGSEGADTIVYGEIECQSASVPGTWVDYGAACCVYAFSSSGPCWRGTQRWAATVWGTSPPLPLPIMGDPVGGTGADYILYSSYCGETTVTCSYLPGRVCRLRTAAPNGFPTTTTMGICGDACGSAGGADGIVGWYSGDEIYANGGDDTIYGLDGSDYIDAGAGNDQAMGMQCSTAYQETILGGSGNDTLYGYRTYQGGNLCPRVIQGDAGLDILRGAPGADWIYGGTDLDELYGYDGYDRCSGGTGGTPPENDLCEASPSCNERPECER